jgi:YbgC/YbaW family acyl-CoA thioester hydrolase
MARTDYRCAHRLRVRWAEVDMQKVVFNGHYLTYIDTAVAEYWREIGLAYPEGYVDRYANDLYLRKATVEYLGPARYDDSLSVHCRVGRLGKSSMHYLFEIWRDAPAPSGEPLITADLVYVNVAVASMKPAPIPEEVRDRVRAYERTPPAEA